MLSSPDADLVRLDPALPGLGTVLDPSRFVDALAARPELGIEAVRVGNVRYKPGRECIVGYRLPRRERAPHPSNPGSTGTLAGPIDLYAVAQRRERRERNQRAERPFELPTPRMRSRALAQHAGEAVAHQLLPRLGELSVGSLEACGCFP